MLTCINCSRELDPTWTFCVECGATIAIAEPAPFVTFGPDGSISVRATNATEAKLAKLELKARKKEFQVIKKPIMETERLIRADYTHSIRTQIPKVRGGGTFGRILRVSQDLSRSHQRASLAKLLAPYEERRREYEAILIRIDEALLRLDDYLDKLK